MADSQKQAEAPAKPKPPIHRYRVLKNISAFPAGHVFDRAEFERVNPLPADPKAKGIDPDTYHDALIGRLMVLKAIVRVPDDTPAEAAPEGPESRPAQPILNAGIKEAVDSALKAQEAAKLPAGATAGKRSQSEVAALHGSVA